MPNLVLIGQSQLSLVTSGELAAFTSTLNSLTGLNVGVSNMAVGGSSLLKAAADPSFPHKYWLNKTDSDSPLYALLASLTTLDAAWWVQGEADAAYGISENQYLAGMVELQAIIAGAIGKTPAQLPFVVTPLGNAARIDTQGWQVRNAQIKSVSQPGFIAGPEYIDLPVGSDNIHLTDAARVTFLGRGAATLAAILKLGSSIAPTSYSGSFSRDISLASGTQTIVGLPFTPSHITFHSVLNTPQGASTPALSDGTDNASSAACTYTTYEGAGGSRTDASIYIIATSSGNGHSGHVSAFPANEFTISWTKIGSGAGTIVTNYTAYL